jgi:(1->4)-alpha-D-glucan 1-alpha-D-glucosylmutase
VLTAVTRHSVRLAESGWGETVLALPTGTWKDRLGTDRYSGSVSPADLFADLPVALLERVDD